MIFYFLYKINLSLVSINSLNYVFNSSYPKKMYLIYQINLDLV